MCQCKWAKLASFDFFSKFLLQGMRARKSAGPKGSRGGRSSLVYILRAATLSPLCFFSLFSLFLSTVSQAQTSLQTERPTIGLVLAGGGAKGVAHVGVIKVLEEAGVEVDVIAGTSMGAIVGGLYAMGKSSKELEEIVHSIDWENLFVDDAPRPQRSIRRKTDDFGFLAEPRLRLRDGTAQLPRGAIKGQKLNLELNRLFRPANGISNFDKLPRPFRAIATDLETGEEVVLASGDLALAVRASMAFPGAFPPVELDGRILVDGGVVNNVPVSVVRDMGADIIIVSNFSQTSSGGPSTLCFREASKIKFHRSEKGMFSSSRIWAISARPALRERRKPLRLAKRRPARKWNSSFLWVDSRIALLISWPKVPPGASMRFSLKRMPHFHWRSCAFE
jgi:predicted acylesterase/phospholipase RssA